MRGADVTGVPRSGRARRLVLGVVGGLALTGAMTVAVLANHLETLTLTGKCFDTYTEGTATVYDSQKGNALELAAYAYDGGTSSWTSTPIGTVTIPMVNGTGPNDSATYTWWIQISDSSYFTSPYTQWEVAYDATGSHGVSQNGVAPITSGTLCSPYPNTPESPLAVALPIAGLAIFAGAFGVAIRRRRNSASAG